MIGSDPVRCEMWSGNISIGLELFFVHVRMSHDRN